MVRERRRGAHFSFATSTWEDSFINFLKAAQANGLQIHKYHPHNLIYISPQYLKEFPNLKQFL